MDDLTAVFVSSVVVLVFLLALFLTTFMKVRDLEKRLKNV